MGMVLQVWAKASPQTEIHVTLLGQPCLLQGPFDEATLKAVHVIGPAQIYPNLSPNDALSSSEQARKALEKIRRVTSLPSLLDRYREKLGKRLDAQMIFLENLESIAEKGPKAVSKQAKPGQVPSQVDGIQKLLKSVKSRIQASSLQKLENLLKKLKTLKNSAQYRDQVEQVFDFYNDSIEPDPEEEFHRAIKKLNIQYTCSFEENDDLSGE